MSLAQDLKVGDVVIVRGMGLGKVKTATNDVWTIRFGRDDDTVEIRREKLDALVRRPMSSADASEIMEILSKKDGEPDPRSWGDQYIESQRTLKTGTPKEQAVLLQKLYRVKSPSSAQQRVLDSYEEALLGELAHALKKKVGTLRNQLHRDQPAFGYQAPERDDDGPIAPVGNVPGGWEEAGAFRVFSGRMAIGEYPVSEADDRDYGDFRANLVQQCLNGDWFAFSREYDDDEGSGTEYVVLNRSAVGRADALIKQAQRLGAVAVEGGSVAFLDEEVRDDKRYRRELEGGNAEVLGRGFVANMGGDGATAILGAHHGSGDQFVLFYVKS